jgi:TRAP-type mannitol/chloroaromatic compound transport system permease small subunit
VIIWAVVGRYAFDHGSVTLEEVQWHLAGMGWLLGLAYTLVVDGHVRVDVIHERLSPKGQGWVELFGLVFLLLPFLGLAVYEMFPYAYSSWQQGETSQAPAGLPYRWVLKSILALSFVLLILAALSRLLKVTALLFGFPKPIRIKSGNDKKEDAS